MVLDHKSNLRIVSFNCNSIKSKVEIIRDILPECDILFCQEIILLEDEIDFLIRISDSFIPEFVPSNLPNSNYGEGRPSGGMVIFH